MKKQGRKQRLSRASVVIQRDAKPNDKKIDDSYILYIDNEHVLYCAMIDRLRCYMLNPNDGTKGDRDVILKGDCRMFIEAVNGLPYMQHLNLGIFQSEIDQLYEDFMERIREEEQYQSHGICEKAQDKVLYVTVYFYRCVQLEIYARRTLEEAQDKMDEITASKDYRATYDGLDIETITLTPELLASLEPAVEAEEGDQK